MGLANVVKSNLGTFFWFVEGGVVVVLCLRSAGYGRLESVNGERSA